MPASLPFELTQHIQRVGKMKIYKSGKIVMKVGDVELDVTKGINTTFYQQLVKVH